MTFLFFSFSFFYLLQLNKGKNNSSMSQKNQTINSFKYHKEEVLEKNNLTMILFYRKESNEIKLIIFSIKY